jgi:hypothetical protein
MKVSYTGMCAGLLLVVSTFTAFAQSAISVTPDNFARAETDMYFKIFASRGALGKFIHFRDLPLENVGVRPNRDTLYSEGLFDLDAGPVTITAPDASGRFMTMMAINEDHYALEVDYGPGPLTWSRLSEQLFPLR